MKTIIEAVKGVTRTYMFAFDPDPEGGFVATCSALPGLATHGTTLDEARAMARDAMEGYIEALLADGEAVPESDSQQVDRRRASSRIQQSAAFAETARGIAARRTGVYVLTPEERLAVQSGLNQLDNGEVASEEEAEAMWKKFGL